jgi:hypothetical protein
MVNEYNKSQLNRQIERGPLLRLAGAFFRYNHIFRIGHCQEIYGKSLLTCTEIETTQISYNG